MKFPVAYNDIEIEDPWRENRFFNFLRRHDPFKLEYSHCEAPPSYFVEDFDNTNLNDYIHAVKDGVVNENKFFSQTERSRLVSIILSKTRFGDDTYDFGFQQLKYDNIFNDVYPLHDGSLITNMLERPSNLRQKSQRDWAAKSRIFKY